MPRERYLQHVTLNTGDIRRSPRSEVANDVVARLRPLVERALTGEHVAVPGEAGYTMTGVEQAHCCLVTLWAPSPMGGTAGPDLIPVLTLGIAARSRCGAYLWRKMHERQDLTYATDPDRTPPEPWLAERLDVGAAHHADAMEWTGDFARCAAWTWLEMRA